MTFITSSCTGSRCISISIGVAVGKGVGFFVGFGVGDGVGDCVGFGVGVTVGVAVGREDGAAVGESETGAEVGTMIDIDAIHAFEVTGTVGDAVGESVGSEWMCWFRHAYPSRPPYCCCTPLDKCGR